MQQSYGHADIHCQQAAHAVHVGLCQMPSSYHLSIKCITAWSLVSSRQKFITYHILENSQLLDFCGKYYLLSSLKGSSHLLSLWGSGYTLLRECI